MAGAADSSIRAKARRPSTRARNRGRLSPGTRVPSKSKAATPGPAGHIGSLRQTDRGRCRNTAKTQCASVAGTQITSRPAARAFTVAAATASAVVDSGAAGRPSVSLCPHEARPHDQHPGPAAGQGVAQPLGEAVERRPWRSHR